MRTTPVERELHAQLQAQLHELHTFELSGMVTLRMSVRIIQAKFPKHLAISYLSACAEEALHRYGRLSERLDVASDAKVLHGLADRIGESLQEERSVDALVQRALVESLTLLHRYDEIARLAIDALDEDTALALRAMGDSVDKQVRVCAKLLDEVMQQAELQRAA